MWSRRRRVRCHSHLPSAKRNRSSCLSKFIALSAVVFALTIDGALGENSVSYTEDAEEKKRVHDIIVEEWYDLVRYLVGLGLCIFGLIGMYFHQFSSYYFVKKYTRPRETEHCIGRVLSCEPLVRSTSGTLSKDKRKKKGKKANIDSEFPITKIGGKAQGRASSITDYVREEDIERHRQQLGMKRAETDQQHTDFRMLVAYTVPKERSTSLVCCNPIDHDLVITCTNSFSVNNCAPDLFDIERVDTYRSRSLPSQGIKHKDYNRFNRINDSNSISNSNYIPRNDDTEYFRWFQTSNPKLVDADIDLILLKGHPKSACTPDLIESHLEQVGITAKNESEKKEYYQSISMLGLVLVMTLIVLALVCVVEILSMPNPETQRPLGFTVLGTHFVLSIVCGYLFAKLRFEQYKQKVFLSAFSVPWTTKPRDADSIFDAKDDSLTIPSDLADVIADNSIRRQFPNQMKEKVLL